MASHKNEEFLTTTEAAEYTKRHINTIRNWIHGGLLPATQIKKRARFSVKKSDLDEALKMKPTSVQTENS